MPITHRKARILLTLGKAKVYKNAPFTIQLMYATEEAKQDDSNSSATRINKTTALSEKILAKDIIEFDDVKEMLTTHRDYHRDAGKASGSATIYELDTNRKDG